MSTALAIVAAIQFTGLVAASALEPVSGPSGVGLQPARVAVGAPLLGERLNDRRLAPPPLVANAGMPMPDAPGSAVEYSEWYYRRLDIHRWGSYAMLPLFAAQYIAGTNLESGGHDDWAEELHPMLAGGVAALFASNTVTGVWNLWEGRKDPKDRTRRFLHAGLMLLADAGFVATGILADEAEDHGGGAGAHKTVALASMTAATLSWAIMLDVFRPD